VSKDLLASREGVLTPRSDAISVARTILRAHDAAELALAAIATEVAAEVRDQATLMEYPVAILRVRPGSNAFPGRSYLESLNRARRDFKHAGNLPHVPDWYRVIEKVTTLISTPATVRGRNSGGRIGVSISIEHLRHQVSTVVRGYANCPARENEKSPGRLGCVRRSSTTSSRRRPPKEEAPRGS